VNFACFGEYSSTFQGTVVGSMVRTRGGYLQLFQWTDPDTVGPRNSAIDGVVILDGDRFSDSEKLGPAIIYVRKLALESLADSAELFGKNAVTKLQAKSRALSAAVPVEWPSDEKYRAGFREMYPAEMLEREYDSLDPIWDDAIALRLSRFIARALVTSGLSRPGKTVRVGGIGRTVSI
jgi:hypothetical protein